MEQDILLQKTWAENELPVLAHSRKAHTEIATLASKGNGQLVFAGLLQAQRLPEANFREAIAQIGAALERYFASDFPELEKMLSAGATGRDEVRLWLWRRVVRSGNHALMASRFFADDFLFYRTLHEDRLFSWYGSRVAEWPIQLLLGLFLGNTQGAQRLRQQLYWPTAKLPEDFQASHAENRALRRLWEGRILVRFGNWVHLHPLIMLQLPEISSFASPVFDWRGHELIAHMPDGRIWTLAPFNLAALIFDETLALFGRDRRGWWRSFAAFAQAYPRRPEDLASHFIVQSFAELGLPLHDASALFWEMFCKEVSFFEDLRIAHLTQGLKDF